MEILDLRHFTSADLRSLLEQETEVWSRSLIWDYSGSAEMILRYIDAKILPGYVAVQRGAVYGYSFFVYEGSKGVVGDIYADREQQPRGLTTAETEQRLLSHVIATLQQSPGVRRIEAQLLVHDSGLVSAPFLHTGFDVHPRLFMRYPLSSTREVRLPAANDIDYRRWSEQDYQDAASVITQSYRGHVDSNINDQYRSVTGSLRFLNNIVRFPGCGTFDPLSSYVAVHRPTRRTVGLILCSRVRDDVGHVTQVCVVPDQRGKRVGETLLALASNELRRRRFSTLSLTVTEANRGAVELYKRLGYTIDRVFDAFVWEE